ncbi:MAG: hypothetical protein CMC08_07260 [Flavobacteriaceae bacterium]|nr:hypothetical protein [Flavobacteriaceae bacterium]
MKKAVSIFIAFLFVSFLIGCKDAETETHIPADGFALSEPETETLPDFLYVSAPSGLTLRQHNNLNSEKLAVMPYCTKVRVVGPETEKTMTVGGIEGGMHEVEFNHKTGFAFSGYLSQFFPPEEDIKPRAYAEALREKHPKVTFNETSGGTASSPTNTAMLGLPTTQWHEAFFIATELFGIPKNFAFPQPKGSASETVQDTKKPKNTMESELVVTRNNDQIQKIEYRYRAKGYGYDVSIVKGETAMEISRTEVSN